MLQEKIEQTRDITYKSLNTYMFSLTAIHKSLETKMKFDDLKWVNDTEEINGFLESYKPTTQKNYVSAIVVALSTEPTKHKKMLIHYKDKLDNLFEQLNTTNLKQELSDTQKKNWATMDILKNVARSYREQVKTIGKTPTKKEIATYQEFLLSLLYTEMPPLRNDYANMLMITEDKLKECSEDSNYFVIGKNEYWFVLNHYKTKKYYGKQYIGIPEKLYPVFSKWVKLNKTNYFLINNKNNPINSNALTKLINKTFSSTGKKIGSGLIRHIYLSDRYEANESKKNEDASAMLHSVATQQKIYVKKTPT